MIEIIKQRLEKYEGATQEDALKEIIQEVALFGLWRAGFFDVAAFQGGTSLRILHNLPRFSEDLDFILLEPNPDFVWESFLGKLVETLNQFGIDAEVSGKDRLDATIQRAIIKDNSLVNQLDLEFVRGDPGRKLRIKLEIDVSPPGGSGFEFTYLDFPSDFEVNHQDLPSNFALKIHAMLCRPWEKGRDWFDFSWYVRQGVVPNLTHLQNAIQQTGPWENQSIEVTPTWLQEALSNKIDSMDWKRARDDVERFLGPTEREGLNLWEPRFFTSRVRNLIEKL